MLDPSRGLRHAQSDADRGIALTQGQARTVSLIHRRPAGNPTFAPAARFTEHLPCAAVSRAPEFTGDRAAEKMEEVYLDLAG